MAADCRLVAAEALLITLPLPEGTQSGPQSNDAPAVDREGPLSTAVK